MSVRFGARRPSSPEAVRPCFLSRAIRQALIRAPCFGAAVRRAVYPLIPPTTRRPIPHHEPSVRLSVPATLRPLTSFYPSRSLHKPFIRPPSLLHYDSPKLAVFLNVVQNSTMFDRCPSNPPHAVRPAICRADRTPRVTHLKGSIRVLYAVLVYHTTTAINSPYFKTSCKIPPCSIVHPKKDFFGAPVKSERGF